ncbi:MAG: glycerol kinase GlpK [Spirochaetaceae bacterium]|nr:MAG: glycerol kinase GlpK [Spirochaetaceae bacterium]
MSTSKTQYVGAIDQGTTSTRFILFDRQGRTVASHQLEHRQIFPQAGWVEHDPQEIWERTVRVIREALKTAGANPRQIAAIGITNQRETTVAWNRKTGQPFGNAIVWQDTRTDEIVAKLASQGAEQGGIDRFREKTGLPLATYFSGPKLSWLLAEEPAVRKAAESGEAAFGTIDSWLIWNLTGGAGGGRLVTDPSNASRTLLMNLESLQWDDAMLGVLEIPPAMLPAIVPSVPGEPYGYTRKDGPFAAEIPVAGVLGDQQAALFGQACFLPGTSKNTYGTGCFLLLNTGEKIIHSQHGLITTVGYQQADHAPVYALEGSIAITGALVQWLRDNLGLIQSSEQIEILAREVEDSGGVYFVPAFSGLFAPYWRSDARGVIAGLSRYATKEHLARAALEATAFQTFEIFEAMERDAGISIPSLKVDGGMVVNEILMQFQADLLDVPVIRPKINETTALGAAFAAGLSVGFWESHEQLQALWEEDRRWNPQMEQQERQRRIHFWKKAVSRSLDWLESEGSPA